MMAGINTAVSLLVIFLAGEIMSTLDNHCTDISYYDALQYTTSAKQCCKPHLKEFCENKSEEVCKDVVEVQCEPKARVECRTETSFVEGKKCEVELQHYDYKDCNKKVTARIDCKQETVKSCKPKIKLDQDGFPSFNGELSCTPLRYEKCVVVDDSIGGCSSRELDNVCACDKVYSPVCAGGILYDNQCTYECKRKREECAFPTREFPAVGHLTECVSQDAKGIVNRDKIKEFKEVLSDIENELEKLVSSRSRRDISQFSDAEYELLNSLVQAKEYVRDHCSTENGQCDLTKLQTLMEKSKSTFKEVKESGTVSPGYVQTFAREKAQFEEVAVVAEKFQEKLAGKPAQPDCTCSEFTNSNGIGRCQQRVKIGDTIAFGGQVACYVNHPTSCKDVIASETNPGKYLSAEACSCSNVSPNNPVAYEACGQVQIGRSGSDRFENVRLSGRAASPTCTTPFQVKWADYTETAKAMTTQETVCEVKKSVECKKVSVNKCTVLDWEECSWRPVQQCEAVFVSEPSQEKVHRKKCLAEPTGADSGPLAFSLSFEGSNEPEAMPNIGYLFRGYDIMKGNPLPTTGLPVDPGFREPIFKASYESGLTTPDLRYLRPDGTSIIDCSGTCSLSFHSESISGVKSYQDSLSAKASISASASYSGWTGKFSASVGYNKVEEGTSSGSHLYTQSSASCCSYRAQTLSYERPPLSENFKKALGTLPEDYDEDAYLDFIDAFGTHIISETDLGALFGQQSQISSEAWKSMKSTGLNIEVAAGLSAYGNSASADFMTDDERKTAEEFQKKSTSQKLVTIGAPPPSDNKISSWVQLAVEAPAPMTVKLDSILDLFDSYEENVVDALATKNLYAVKANLEKALNDYCSFLVKVGATKSCSAPGPDPPFPDDETAACDSLSNGILIRGWRDTIVGMSADDIRNTVIVELNKATGRTDLQGLNDDELLELICACDSLSNGILIKGWRDTIVGMSADDIRNTVIVELNKETGRTDLQGLNDDELLALICGDEDVMNPNGKMSLFSENYGKGDLVCDLEWNHHSGATWYLKQWNPCKNDEARSMRLESAVKGTKISVYDSPDGSISDDYTDIKVLKDITSPILLDTFHSSFTNEFLDVTFHAVNGLDGKVSHIAVDTADI